MAPVLGWVLGNRARTAAIAAIAIGWLPLVGVPDAVVGGLGSILAILIAGPGVHDAVTPVATVVTTVREATKEAADTVARGLDVESVGEAGVATGAGLVVATSAARLAAESALQDLGVRRRDRVTGP